MMLHLQTILGLLLSLLLLCTKGSNIVDNGGGTEITGYIVTRDAAPVTGVLVRLINPMFGDTFTAITAQSGMYTFSNEIPSGRYTLQGSKDSLACVIFNLRYEPPYQVRVDTIRNTGWIFASVSLDKSSNKQGIEVYIPGTSFTGKSDTSGNVLFWYVPPGSYSVMFEKHGFIPSSDTAFVLSGFTDTVGPVTLVRDHSVPVEIPVPTGLSAVTDTIWGTVQLSWDSSTQNVQGYYVRIIDTLIDKYPEDGRVRFTKATTFTDTVFTEKSYDTTQTRYRVYQVCVLDINSNRGQWGNLCSLNIKKPVVPPPPSCSLYVNPDGLSVSVNANIPPLWWIDSIFICRSVLGQSHTLQYLLLTKKDFFCSDPLHNLPFTTEKTIPISYTVYLKSVYGYMSAYSTTLITINNPFLLKHIETPAAPTGLPVQGEATTYAVTISTINSTIETDTIEYCLKVTRETDSAVFFTDWYSIPLIEISLLAESRYFIQTGARSKRLHGLVSEFSGTCTIDIYKEHVVPKPSTPSGDLHIVHSNTYSYISQCVDTCTFGHKVQIRYVVFYQNESASDSTDWGPVPGNPATIYWVKPGIAYLRAQAKCTENPHLVSSWSDALVVTIE
jgi:hypothetical protein